MAFDRSLLPSAESYLDREGVRLSGRGKWRTGPCLQHGSSDSLRVNVESGAFVCMAGCGFKGGDVLAYHMQRHGLEFGEACKSLGAWVEDLRSSGSKVQAALPFSARSALEVVRFEALLVAVCACNLARGIELASADRERLVQAAARIEFIAAEIVR